MCVVCVVDYLHYLLQYNHVVDIVDNDDVILFISQIIKCNFTKILQNDTFSTYQLATKKCIALDHIIYNKDIMNFPKSRTLPNTIFSLYFFFLMTSFLSEFV